MIDSLRNIIAYLVELVRSGGLGFRIFLILLIIGLLALLLESLLNESPLTEFPDVADIPTGEASGVSVGDQCEQSIEGFESLPPMCITFRGTPGCTPLDILVKEERTFYLSKFRVGGEEILTRGYCKDGDVYTLICNTQTMQVVESRALSSQPLCDGRATPICRDGILLPGWDGESRVVNISRGLCEF